MVTILKIIEGMEEEGTTLSSTELVDLVHILTLLTPLQFVQLGHSGSMYSTKEASYYGEYAYNVVNVILDSVEAWKGIIDERTRYETFSALLAQINSIGRVTLKEYNLVFAGNQCKRITMDFKSLTFENHVLDVKVMQFSEPPEDALIISDEVELTVPAKYLLDCPQVVTFELSLPPENFTGILPENPTDDDLGEMKAQGADIPNGLFEVSASASVVWNSPIITGKGEEVVIHFNHGKKVTNKILRFIYKKTQLRVIKFPPVSTGIQA